MDPTVITATISSTITSNNPNPVVPTTPPLVHLEISLISAQNLTPVSKSMHTYAMAWITPNRKYTTRTDHTGHTNPTWNDKFVFRLDNPSITSQDAALTVEIYALSWFRDVHVGTVNVLMTDLLTPPSGVSLHSHPKNMRFIALQVRRQSGTPQGILHMGVALIDASKKKTTKYLKSEPMEIAPQNDELDLEKKKLEEKINQWRMKCADSEQDNEDFTAKAGSIINGSSMVNGSELLSDIGPSASVVALEMMMMQMPANQMARVNRNKQYEDTGSSILEDLTFEEARAIGFKIGANKERWKKGMVRSDRSDQSSDGGDRRRNSDSGLFSCLGSACGIEFRITCGGNNTPNSNNNNKSKQINSKGKNKVPITDHANSD